MIDNIDYSKTIKSDKIVLKSKWMELFDMLLFYLGIGAFVFFNLKAFFVAGIQNDEKLWLVISPLLIIFMVFLLYKKLNEKKLLLVQTPFDKNKNREFVLDFVKENGFLISYDNANYLIAEKLQGFKSGKQITFLFSSKLIKFNCLAIAVRVRTPLFFYQYSLKRKLEEKISNLALSTKV